MGPIFLLCLLLPFLGFGSAQWAEKREKDAQGDWGRAVELSWDGEREADAEKSSEKDRLLDEIVRKLDDSEQEDEEVDSRRLKAPRVYVSPIKSESSKWTSGQKMDGVLDDDDDDDSESDSDSDSDEDDEWDDEYDEFLDEFHFLPIDRLVGLVGRSEDDLDFEALRRVALVGAQEPLPQQNLVIIHETVNVGKIEVNQGAKAGRIPPLTDVGVVQILSDGKPNLLFDEETGSDERQRGEIRELSGTREEVQSDKKIQPPRFQISPPSEEESERKDEEKEAAKTNEKLRKDEEKNGFPKPADSIEVVAHVDDDLEPLRDGPLPEVSPVEQKSFVLPHWLTRPLGIIDFLTIGSIIILAVYIVRAFLLLLRRPPTFSFSNSVEAKAAEPIPAEHRAPDVKITMDKEQI